MWKAFSIQAAPNQRDEQTTLHECYTAQSWSTARTTTPSAGKDPGGKHLRDAKRHPLPRLTLPLSSSIYNMLPALLWKANSNLSPALCLVGSLVFRSHPRRVSPIPLYLLYPPPFFLQSQFFLFQLNCIQHSSVAQFLLLKHSSSRLNQQFSSLCKNAFIFPRPSVLHPSGCLYLWDHCPLHGISSKTYFQHSVLDFSCLFYSTMHIFPSPPSPCEFTMVNLPLWSQHPLNQL